MTLIALFKVIASNIFTVCDKTNRFKKSGEEKVSK